MTQAIATATQPVESKNGHHKSINHIDLTLVRLVLETGSSTIRNPRQTIATTLDDVQFTEIDKRLKFLKDRKLIRTQGKAKSSIYTSLEVSDILISKILGPNTLRLLQKDRASQSEKEKMPISLFVDLENIRLTEEEFGIKISYSKILDYFTSRGHDIYFKEIVAPPGYQDAKYRDQTAVLTKLGWKFVISGHSDFVSSNNRVKDRDKLDEHLKDFVRQILYYHWWLPQEIWIISRDRDFESIIRLNADRRKYNVKLIDPFKMTEFHGLTPEEERLFLLQEEKFLIEILEGLSDNHGEDKIDYQRYIRCTMAWLFIEGTKKVLQFNSYALFIKELDLLLARKMNRKIKGQFEFCRNILQALKSLHVINRINSSSDTCIYVVDKRHELFKNACSKQYLDLYLQR